MRQFTDLDLEITEIISITFKKLDCIFTYDVLHEIDQNLENSISST